MAKLLKLRRGTTTQHGSFTGAEGEVTIDTTKDTAVVHDGSTQAGRPLAREDMSNVSSASIAGRLGTDSIAPSKIAAGALPTDVTITNANIVANASIEGTKLENSGVTAGAYGSSSAIPVVTVDAQGLVTAASTTAIDSTRIDNGTSNVRVANNGATNVSHSGTDRLSVTGSGVEVTGTLSSSNITVSNTQPFISFQDTDNENDFEVGNAGGTFRVRDVDASANRLTIASNGRTTFSNDVGVNGNLDVGSGCDVTGNITCTGTVDGRDVAADGTKLDGIESGATADQTKSDIDALNINADTVDSLHASSFLRSDTNDQASGDITFNGGAGAVSVGAGSDIRINGGTWTGEYNSGIKIQPDATNSYFQYKGSLFFRRGSDGSNRLQLDSSGNLTAQGNVTAYSDARLKTDIHTINDALDICGKLRGVSYKWIADGKPSIGVIAQEVEEVIPEVVLTNVNTDPATGEETEVKSVDYGKIVGVLINAINELKKEVEELKNAKITG